MPNLLLLRHGESQWNLENRFTGWTDVSLSPKGEQEAHEAGEKLKSYKFDKAYTSVLKRAIDTLQIVLKITGQQHIPIEYDKALNERHYGALQGLNKAETAKKYGDGQVKLWRRSYDVPPPNDVTELNPLGMSESLKDTAARTLPYFESRIMPDIRAGKNILVAAHGNSLRSIVMQLDNLTKEQVIELNIPTGVPLLYVYDAKGNITEHRYL
ncbi:MAG TPA: 2,3-bisphosphoglycerate-dependent phosphoglycerate mutase [Bacteroidetes bacterium]|nr:MAG: 2,3-bisphosphoglycerate-dependent phosphoglycerate mutase [Ignavibacteria bacterium GWA2_54_16]HCA81978.1 2,3-bisphosphoglycerate-dependent phosphoglycerate mutase [Bacteroidota bacterium]